MKRRTALFILSLAVAGCQTYWTKPGFNQAEWNRDRYECERDMRQSGYYGSGLFGAINAQNFFEECLVARGYYKNTLRETAPPAPSLETNGGSAMEHCRICPDCASCKTGNLADAPKADPAMLVDGCLHGPGPPISLDTCMDLQGFRFNGTEWIPKP